MYAWEKKVERRRRSQTRGLGQHAENLKIKGLANGISCVFRKTFSVNKYEGKFLALSVRYSACREKIRVKL